jgi:ribonuclease HII
VVAAACIIPPDVTLPSALDDSKRMTEADRDTVYDQICTDSRIQWSV